MQLALVAARADRGVVRLHREAWPITAYYWLYTRYARRVLHFNAFHFDISRYVSLCSSQTRLSSHRKLRHAPPTSNNSSRNFYFNRLPRLWKSLPLLDISLSIPTIITKLYQHFWGHFSAIFDPDNLCSYHYLCPCANSSSLPVTYNYNFDSSLL